MNLFERYAAGHPYAEFLAKYGTPAHQARWEGVLGQVAFTDEQQSLIRNFKREMPVLVLAGAWCGDCAGQCPIFEAMARLNPLVKARYLDRDEHADVQAMLKINGGNRVPVAVFFSEDGHEVARYGERTLTRYRQLAAEQAGESCGTGIQTGGTLAGVAADWLREFERVSYILRLSPRLRQKHGD